MLKRGLSFSAVTALVMFVCASGTASAASVTVSFGYEDTLARIVGGSNFAISGRYKIEGQFTYDYIDTQAVGGVRTDTGSGLESSLDIEITNLSTGTTYTFDENQADLDEVSTNGTFLIMPSIDPVRSLDSSFELRGFLPGELAFSMDLNLFGEASPPLDLRVWLPGTSPSEGISFDGFDISSFMRIDEHPDPIPVPPAAALVLGPLVLALRRRGLRGRGQP